MRALKLILVISLVSNLLLLVACAVRALANTGTSPVAVHAPSHAQPTTSVREKTITNTVVATNAARLLDWSVVESEDYKKYVANLRVIGCPEKTIRDIIVADVNELYRHRFLLAFPRTNRVEYWKGDALANLIDEEHVRKLQDFGKERRELIASLLGTDYTGEVEMASVQTDIFMEQLLEFLTPEKRDAMKDLEHRYTAKYLNTVKDAVRGDNRQSEAVLTAKDQEVLKILTPEEKLEYDLRRSNEAMFLRVALGDFAVTKQEFRDVFPGMKRFITAAGLPSLMAIVRGDGDPREETLKARQDLQKAVRSALGEKRFAELIDGTGWNLAE